jgi:hypothetical protein
MEGVHVRLILELERVGPGLYVSTSVKRQLAKCVANEDSRLCRTSEATIGTGFALRNGRSGARRCDAEPRDNQG